MSTGYESLDYAWEKARRPGLVLARIEDGSFPHFQVMETSDESDEPEPLSPRLLMPTIVDWVKGFHEGCRYTRRLARRTVAKAKEA